MYIYAPLFIWFNAWKQTECELQSREKGNGVACVDKQLSKFDKFEVRTMAWLSITGLPLVCNICALSKLTHFAFCTCISLAWVLQIFLTQYLYTRQPRHAPRCEGVCVGEWRRVYGLCSTVLGCVCVWAGVYSHNTRTHILQTALNYGSSLHSRFLALLHSLSASCFLLFSLSTSLPTSTSSPCLATV